MEKRAYHIHGYFFNPARSTQNTVFPKSESGNLVHSGRNYTFPALFRQASASNGVAPCNLVDTDRYFRAIYCLHHQGDE
jgi:hypothetical protein